VTPDCVSGWPIGTGVDRLRKKPDVIPVIAYFRGGPDPHLGPTRVPNGIWSGSSIFAQFTVVTNKQTQTHRHI